MLLWGKRKSDLLRPDPPQFVTYVHYFIYCEACIQRKLYINFIVWWVGLGSGHENPRGKGTDNRKGAGSRILKKAGSGREKQIC